MLLPLSRLARFARFARFARSARRSVVLLATCCLGSQALVAAAAAPPIEHFFANAHFSRAALSPNGKLLAVVVGVPGKRDALRVIDLEANKAYPTAAYTDDDIYQFQWVNDKRLIYNLTDHQLADGDDIQGPGLFAVNIDGSELRQLADREWSNAGWQSAMGTRKMPPTTAMLSNPGLQNSSAVFVTNYVRDHEQNVSRQLYRIDTISGVSQRVAGPAGTSDWILDAEGEPRIAVRQVEQNQEIHLRDRASGEWKQLASFNAYAGGKGGFEPLAFGADGTLYVEANQGKDTSAVYAYNTSTGKVDAQSLIEMAGYDFNGYLLMNKGALQGVRYVTDTRGTVWLDAGMKALQADIDAKLSDTINTITAPRRPESPWVLIESHSDIRPAFVTLYNTSTKSFNVVGASHPQIKPEEMGRQKMLTYKSRDGLTIPALLTLPPGQKKNLPLVVLVHGGPFVRGSVWGWNAESQFLASRGYAVLEPSFRGTTGFGDAHYRAGFRQWGLTMQNDIADGAKFAIEQGIADSKRICIAGASYGGYATLMGLVNDPDLFRCGVNWVGVTDLMLMHKGRWRFQSDMSSTLRKYGMPEMVGDYIKDAEQLKATSPLTHAARIKQPLLMAYGGSDRRVPLDHGTTFYKAVKKTNADVEWVVYPAEGHGFFVTENKLDFYKRMERFLERNIGKSASIE